MIVFCCVLPASNKSRDDDVMCFIASAIALYVFFGT